MKNFKILLAIFVFIFSIISCQKEEIEIIENPVNFENLDPNSSLTNLICRVAQNPTSQDNIVDGSSCFSVQLPVTVIVNNQQITIANQTQYQTVQNAINAFSNDDDLVNFIYPITIKFQNFQTEIIPNKNKLDDALNRCGEDDDFDEIDCAKINYPITINTYNPNNQIANTVTIQSNSQLFNFLKSLSKSDIVAINYPISFTNPNNQIVTINNNSELQNAIEDAISSCNNSSGGSSPFATIIVSGSWKITYLYNKKINVTALYTGYNLSFNTVGIATAISNTNTINGTWSTYIDNSQKKLSLDFDGSTLKDLEEDWKVIEYTQTAIRLRQGGSSDADYMYLAKN